MSIVFMLLGAAAALELLLQLKIFWRFRKVVAGAALIAGAFGAGALAVAYPVLFSIVFAWLSLYRVFNMLRIVEGRMHEHHLRHTTRRTTWVLLIMQVFVLAGWLAWDTWGDTGHIVWAVVAIAQLLVAAGLFASVMRNLRRMRWPHQDLHYSDKDLPSVTIAIPARNETDDLQVCLQSIIASDYPKLEIIVLDDCSQVRRTPEIIRAFAHDGVRFVQGREPADDWLPKNRAYARLTEEASGKYILFCGADVRLAPQTLREIITAMMDRNKSMMSILPRREQHAYGHLSLVQAMRYWWELVPPRRLVNRPPVLSSCWAITTEALKKAGGFAAVSRTIVPEAYFARELTKTDGYSFLRASTETGVTSNKTVGDQRDTAIRTRYPQVHRRPEQVALLALLEAAFLLLPFGLAIAGFWVSVGQVAHISAIVSSLLLIAVYQRVVLSTHVNNIAFSLIGQPFMVLADLAMLHYSMYKYELSEVDWKGRNVCVPVMHVTPTLPKVD
jgi:hypothetical protein